MTVDEWTEDREAGQLGFRLIQDEDGALWLEMRVEEDGVWSEWMEEDLDGPGNDVLGRIPAILAAERARIRRELLEWLDASRDSDGVRKYWFRADELRAALDRIAPSEGKE